MPRTHPQSDIEVNEAELEDDDGEDAHERVQWKSQWEFIFSCIGLRWG